MPGSVQAKEYSRMVCDPKTPYEWQLALSDPNSPIYKLMMEVVAEEVINYSILCEVITRWVLMQEMKKEHVLQQMLDDHKAYEEMIQSRLAAQTATATNIIIPTEKAMLEQFINDRKVEMDSFRSEVGVIQDNIKKIDENINKLDIEWNKKQNVQAKDYCDELNKKLDEKGKLHGFHEKIGNVVCEITDKKLKKIEAAYHVPSPSKVLEYHPKILRKKADEKEIKRCQEVICGRNEFVRELGIKAAAIGLNKGDNLKPSDFVKKAKAFDKALPVPRTKPDERKEDEAAVSAAIAEDLKKRAEKAKLKVAEKSLKAAEQAQELAVERLAALESSKEIAAKPVSQQGS